MVLMAIVGELGSGKTLALTYLMWKNHFKKGRRIFSNYNLYGIPHTKITSLEDLENAKNGFIGLDEAWVWLDARTSNQQMNQVTSSILLESRKKGLTFCYTAQHITQIDARIRNVTDFTVYPIMKANEKLVQALVFNGSKPREENLMRTLRFHPKPVYKFYDSITGDIPVPFFDDGRFYYKNMEEVEEHSIENMQVPSFNPDTYEMELKPVEQFHKHKVNKDVYRIKTNYGKEIKVTGDHSIFSWNFDRDVHSPSEDPNGELEKTEVRKLSESDYVAIPSTLPIEERDRDYILVSDFVENRFKDNVDNYDCNFQMFVFHPDIDDMIYKEKPTRNSMDGRTIYSENEYDEVMKIREETGFGRRNISKMTGLPESVIGNWIHQGTKPQNNSKVWTLNGKPFNELSDRNKDGRKHLINSCRKQKKLPLRLAKMEDDIDLRDVDITWRFEKNKIPNKIEVDEDLLWLLGFYFAEGCITSQDHQLNFTSEKEFIDRADKILQDKFNANTFRSVRQKQSGYSVEVHSDIIVALFKELEKRKDFILQLPKSKSKYFIQGFWEGDGYHNGKIDDFVVNQEDKEFIDWFETLLLRFGIVPSKGRYTSETTTPQGNTYENSMSRLQARVNTLDFEMWDEELYQRRQAIEENDLIITKIREIEKLPSKERVVYDFSVKDNENFIAGGVCAKNTRESIPPLKQVSNTPFCEVLNEERELRNEEDDYDVI